jgi:hypothetical protein
MLLLAGRNETRTTTDTTDNKQVNEMNAEQLFCRRRFGSP